MASPTQTFTRERLSIVGDALLLTAAAFSAITGLTALLIAPTGTPATGTEWLAAVASLLSMSVVIVVPVLVWLLHGRRLSLSAVLGGAMGACSTTVVFIVVVAAASLVDLVITPLTGWEFAGPLTMLAVISISAVVLIVWLAVDAVGDLATDRSHPLIDVLRLVSVVVLAIFTAGVIVWTVAHPGDQTIEALVFALVAGVAGALAVGGAELLSAVWPTPHRADDDPASPGTAAAARQHAPH